MKNKRVYAVVLLLASAVVLMAAQIVGYLDLQLRATPGSPASGYLRIWSDSGTGNVVKCKTSAGAACTFDSGSSSGTHGIGMAWGQAGGSTLSTGASSVTIPFSCTIQGTWYAYADSGTVTFGIAKNGTTIVSGGAPSATAGAATGSTSGWTTSVSAGDLMAFSIATTSSATNASIVLGCN